MEFEFANKDLENMFETGKTKSKLFLGNKRLFDSFFEVMDIIDLCESEMKLRQYESLHYEKLKGNLKGSHSLILEDGWRLIVKRTKGKNGIKLIICDVIDYH